MIRILIYILIGYLLYRIIRKLARILLSQASGKQERRARRNEHSRLNKNAVDAEYEILDDE